jgi:hypothetical protein
MGKPNCALTCEDKDDEGEDGPPAADLASVEVLANLRNVICGPRFRHRESCIRLCLRLRLR